MSDVKSLDQCPLCKRSAGWDLSEPVHRITQIRIVDGKIMYACGVLPVKQQHLEPAGPATLRCKNCWAIFNLSQFKLD